jgi:hypothetical protein
MVAVDETIRAGTSDTGMTNRRQRGCQRATRVQLESRTGEQVVRLLPFRANRANSALDRFDMCGYTDQANGVCASVWKSWRRLEGFPSPSRGRDAPRLEIGGSPRTADSKMVKPM